MSVKASKYLYGFSLIELTITVGIAGILTAIAIPSFNSIISNNRMTTYANEFVTAINLARSEAVKRGTRVTIKRIKDTSNPKDGWNLGWEIFVDTQDTPTGNTLNNFMEDENNPPCKTDAAGFPEEDCKLRVYAGLPDNFSFLGDGQFKDDISFNALGQLTSDYGFGGTLKLCDQNRNNIDKLKSAKYIVLNKMGRVRIATDTDNDGYPNMNDSTNFDKCDF